MVALVFIVGALRGNAHRPAEADGRTIPFGRANLDADVVWTGVEAIAGIWMAVVLFFAHRYFTRRDFKRGLPVLFGGTALFVTITLFFFINNIEGYSQRAAIDFFEQRQGRTVLRRSRKGYRSYAQLFYTRKPPATDPRAQR